MESISNSFLPGEQREKGENDQLAGDYNQLESQLTDIQARFTAEVKEIRTKYFSDPQGLTVLSGNGRFEVCFAIGFDYLKDRTPGKSS